MKQLKKTLLTLALLLTAATGAWATDYTTLAVGDVIKVGDKFSPTAESEGAINDFGVESGKIYKLIRADVDNDYYVTEETDGAYYVFEYAADEFRYIHFEKDFAVTAISDGLVVTKIETIKGKQSYTLALHEPAASSGPEVAWNKTEKTGTFNMPGGNVTLEPEYYPQAVLTAAPTAIDNVPATTDGAIVNAGTVENIGETTTAQGTVMYYVSPTALDDAALLALAADAWTDDVPTAESLAEGQAYVYYYVRGNDSDTDEENFSDGDILAANALTVTIAAEPLWNAEFDLTNAPEEDKAGKWSTDIPEGGVVKGTEVTVTYSGTKKVIGVKAEKKAAKPAAEGHALSASVVGEIVGSDGKAYAAADKDNLPKGVKAEALVCYVDGEHGLALAMADVKDAKMSWDNNRGANDGKTAAEWCTGWNTSHPITGATWLLASQTQWNNMISAAGSASNLSNAFSAVGGTNLQAFSYWSSTPHQGGSAAWRYYFPSSSWSWTWLNQDNTGSYIRACLEW